MQIVNMNCISRTVTLTMAKYSSQALIVLRNRKDTSEYNDVSLQYVGTLARIVNDHRMERLTMSGSCIRN